MRSDAGRAGNLSAAGGGRVCSPELDYNLKFVTSCAFSLLSVTDRIDLSDFGDASNVHLRDIVSWS